MMRRPTLCPGLANFLFSRMPANGEWVNFGLLINLSQEHLTDEQCSAYYLRVIEDNTKEKERAKASGKPFKHRWRPEPDIDRRCDKARRHLVGIALNVLRNRAQVEFEEPTGKGMARRFRRLRPAATPASCSLSLSKIRIGERCRSRTDDLTSLATSLQTIGLLHPLVIDGNHQLVAGFRRFKAAEMLRWEQIEVRVVASLTDAVQALRAERDENTCRVNLDPVDAHALQQRLLDLERPAAKERQRKGQSRGGKTAGRGRPKDEQVPTNLGETYPPPDPQGEAAKLAAEPTGYCAETLRKVGEVMAAAEKEPERFGDLPETIKDTGKVEPAHQEMKKRKCEASSEDESDGDKESVFHPFHFRDPGKFIRHLSNWLRKNWMTVDDVVALRDAVVDFTAELK